MGESELDKAKLLILNIGSKYFGDPPDDVRTLIESIEDEENLKRIAERLFTASGWNEVVEEKL